MLALLLTGFAIMLILEGMLPFVAPRVWKDMFRRMLELTDGQLRFMGMASMGVGLLLLYAIA